jgi:DNA-binding NarL/FixJ family response regulator
MVDVTDKDPSLWDAEALGRGAQWRCLSEAVESVTRQGRAIWLSGEPGIGKTVLLEQAGEYAASRGLRLLRVSGAESEQGLPFAALHQLLWTLTEEKHALSPAARAALDRALGMDPDDTTASYTVAAATLDLLAAAARHRPLALLIDDLHWLDESSAEALHFVRRRLSTVPVVMLATVREEAVPDSDFTGVTILDLEPLTAEGADGLLCARHPGLSPTVRRRILQEAGGNPLALVELPAQLAEGERTGTLSLPEHLPLGERLSRMFARRVAGLSASAQFTLLLCALEGREGASLHLVSAAARAAGAEETETELAVAEELGLVHVDARTARMRFRHPLVRSSLVAAAAGAERRRAHAAWAEVLPPGDLRQVTHRAAATAVPDEAVATALAEAAHRAQARGGDAEAAHLLARAAGLSGDAVGRGQRLVAAALCAVKGGWIALADQLLREATAQPDLPPDSAVMLDFTRAMVRFQADGDTTAVVDLVPGVLDRLSGWPGTEAMRGSSMFLLLISAKYSAAPRAWEAADGRLDDAPELARLGRDAWHDPARRARGGADSLAAMADTVTGESVEEVWLFLWTAVALDLVGDYPELIQGFAQRHSYVTQAFIGIACGYGDYLHGQWDRCVETARSGGATSRGRGFHLFEYVFRYTEGFVTAARGQRQEVDAMVASLRPWADERGLTFILHRVRSMQAMCALALGDHESAYAHACAITPPGTLPPDVSHFQLVFLDLVEAAVHTGRHEEARRHVAVGRAVRMELISPHHGFVLRAAEALVSEDVDATCSALYATAGVSRWPFELARVRLYHGGWLRRHGRRAQAREQLRTALRAFRDLGADPWADRAGEELRVCDDAPPQDATTDGTTHLTPQELRIARLVADGLTNRDVGLRLHLSPRTVAGHLYKIYPKLGVTSRAGVARALGERRDTDDALRR